MKKFYLLIILLLTQVNLYSQANWDGDNAFGNFSYWDNWYGNTFPSTGSTVDLIFNYKNGSQTSLYFDLPWTSFKSINYASTFPVAISLNGNGNGIDFYGKIENYSSYKQTINIPTSYKGGSAGEINAINGDLEFSKPIYNDNQRNFNLYSANNKSVVLSNPIFFGDNSVSLSLKNAGYGKLIINENLNSSSFSGGINVERGELWFKEGKSTNGGILKIGNGDSNVAKLYNTDIDGGTTITNNIIIPTSSTNSFIGAFNTSGTNTFSGGITLNSTGNLEGWNDGTVNFSGVISGTGNLILANNPQTSLATIQLSGNNTYSGTTEIKPLTVLSLNGSEKISNSSGLILSGGTLSTNGNTETFNTLNSKENSKINLHNSVHQINFAASNAVSWTSDKILTIENWQGNAGSSGTKGKIFVGNSVGGLTTDQLSKINFTGFSNGATQLLTGEIIPCSSVILSSAAETEDQTLLNNNVAITPIVYTIGNVTPSVSGLPAGISGVFSGNTFTISGTPTELGIFNYTVSYTSSCGTITDSTGKITVNSFSVENANIQYPKNPITTLEDSSFDIYAQVKLTGVTDDESNDGTGITVDIGFSSVEPTSLSDFTTSDWTWLPAIFNVDYTSSLPYYNNQIDEFKILDFVKKAKDAGKPLAIGTEYFYVSRAQRTGGIEYVYGGIDGTDDNVSGGIWDGITYFANKLKISDEIIWTTDDKWKYFDSYSGNYLEDPLPLDGQPNPVIPTLFLKTKLEKNYGVNDPSFTTKELEINSGITLTIPADQFVKVKGEIINNNGNNAPETIVVQSDGNLIQLDNIANTSKITVERSVTDVDNKTGKIDYIYWSSPVKDQILKGATGFSPGTPNKSFLEYRESDDKFVKTGDEVFALGKGYAIKAESGLGATYNKTYQFKGIPNNGDFSYPINRSADNPVGVVHGYNLIGNPYPSNINFDELYLANSGLIYNTIWFWTNAVYEGTQLGSDYGGNNYAIYNGTGGVGATSPYSGGLTPTGIVKVGQSFIIQKKDEGSGNLLFKNSYSEGHDLRVADATIFFSKQNLTKNRFWLTLLSPSNLVNTQLIGYISGASDEFEMDYDSEAFAASSDLFYSVLNDKKLVIQGKSGNFADSDHINLGANFFTNGNYTISLQNAEGIFANEQPIYLKDNITGIVTNLSEANYTFTAIKGLNNSRFRIIYRSEIVLNTTDVSKEDWVVYRDADDFVLKSSTKIDEVEVYDAMGRLLFKISPHRTQVSLPAEKLSSGIYFLKIKRNELISTKKIVK